MSELPPSMSPRQEPAASFADLPARPAGVQRAQHGLTTPGVVVIVVAFSLVGWLVDRFTLDNGTIFAVAFIASCVYVALQVRRRDLLAAVIVPPLVFAALTVVKSLVDNRTGGWSDQVLDIVSELATEAPALWAGTALAAVIVVVRWRRG